MKNVKYFEIIQLLTNFALDTDTNEETAAACMELIGDCRMYFKQESVTEEEGKKPDA